MGNYFLVFTALVLFVTLQSCNGSKKTQSDKKAVNFNVAFYNVENVFDIIDNPDKIDDDFTPEGKNKWTAERYEKKLNNLAKVFKVMDDSFPAIIGLCEIENKMVVEDLGKKLGRTYQVSHFQSPDKRGIDNALMFDTNLFELVDEEAIKLEFPSEDDYTSRDILHTTLLEKASNKEIHLFVNHWPSRRGGLKVSAPRRAVAAKTLKVAIDKLFSKEENPNIVIMGDFNDEPNNESVEKILNARSTSETIENEALYNLMYTMDEAGEGSHRYKDDWNMLDQFIVSGNLVQQYIGGMPQATVFSADFMIYNDPKYGKKPNRTYGGPNYYGGYSDHFPIYMSVHLK